MFELLISACLFFAGAILERNTKGQVTQIILYSDSNLSTECKK